MPRISKEQLASLLEEEVSHWEAMLDDVETKEAKLIIMGRIASLMDIQDEVEEL